jgi:hypothetical protein
MANMSYCRFENTVNDMQDCLVELYESTESGLSFEQFMKRLGSDYERQAVKRMEHLIQEMQEVLEQMRDNEGLSEEELEDLENE